MSTNYYLHRDPQSCGECGKPGREAEIHVGKHSGGWVFTWQGFDADESPSGSALCDAETWRAFLTAEVASGGWIEAEYGVKYGLEEFFAEVEELRGQGRRHSDHYTEAGIAKAGPDDVSYGEWE
jgi:hypothetical protein